MYTRFVWNRPHPKLDAEAGIFDAYWTIERRLDAVGGAGSRRQRQETPNWRRERQRWIALRSAVREFGSLQIPFRGGRPVHPEWKRALFWFVDDAACVGHAKGTILLTARAVAHELSKWDVEVRELHREDPGEVIWNDGDQVLAKPPKDLGRAF